MTLRHRPCRPPDAPAAERSSADNPRSEAHLGSDGTHAFNRHQAPAERGGCANQTATMIAALKAFDRRMEGRSRAAIVAVATCGVLVVGGVDYLSGFELSMSLFYLGPVAVAAWYAGKRSGVAIALLSCATWYLADVIDGVRYSNAGIPVWNALVRLGFFLITGLLLAALRTSLRAQQRLAGTDSLTGLCSRRLFEERLEHDLALAQRQQSALTLAYVDADDFKTVNDTRGHAEGDRVLRTIGKALKEGIRDTDTAARLGGDEFALIFPDTDSADARQMMGRVARELHRALGPDDRRVTCSIGVVTFVGLATTPERAVAAADALMYEVKRAGKGNTSFREDGEPVVPTAAARTIRASR